ncbi:MAG: hypothetical protein M3Q65_09700, partial [Chloroflexota bacterium]|nr:hypothetical protein [Chloroflexota bacterium]
MARTAGGKAPAFTQTVNGFAELGLALGIAPAEDNEGTGPGTEVAPESAPPARTDTAPADDDAGPSIDPLGRLIAVKALGAALVARRERDREERAAALRELAVYDEDLAALGALERDLAEARAVRTGFEDALTRPFDDPEWIYDQALRDDYATAIAEATATEGALAALIDDRRRAAEGLAATPVVARLLDERRRSEEAVRAQENAAEANRQRS